MKSPGEFEPRCMATAIGSLPHTHVEEAVDLILEVLPNAPLWPQLPRLDWREGMMVQYVEGLPGIRFDETKQKTTLDIEEATFALEDVQKAYENKDTSSASISAEFSHCLAYFCEQIAARPAPKVVKGHVTGPVTQALALETNFEDRAAFYEPELARMIAQYLGLKARFQEELFAKAAPGAQTLIFFDEPSLGSIGSAVLNIDANLAVETLRIAADACQGLTGIHCCGETDLGLIADTGINVINFDAFDYLDIALAAGKQLNSFLEKGGMLAIGLVPSSLPHPEAIVDESLESLKRRLNDTFEALTRAGLDRDLLIRRSFLTPSCGTGGMTPENARRSLELTAQLSETLQS